MAEAMFTKNARIYLVSSTSQRITEVAGFVVQVFIKGEGESNLSAEEWPSCSSVHLDQIPTNSVSGWRVGPGGGTTAFSITRLQPGLWIAFASLSSIPTPNKNNGRRVVTA